MPTALGPRSLGREDNRGPKSSLQGGQEKAPWPLRVRKEEEAIAAGRADTPRASDNTTDCRGPRFLNLHTRGWPSDALLSVLSTPKFPDSWQSNSSLASGVFKVWCLFGWNRMPLSLKATQHPLKTSKSKILPSPSRSPLPWTHSPATSVSFALASQGLPSTLLVGPQGSYHQAPEVHSIRVTLGT